MVAIGAQHHFLSRFFHAFWQGKRGQIQKIASQLEDTLPVIWFLRCCSPFHPASSMSYKETRWLGMHKQAGTRAGNHLRHTRTINFSPPMQANNSARATKGSPPTRSLYMNKSLGRGLPPPRPAHPSTLEPSHHNTGSSILGGANAPLAVTSIKYSYQTH